ncbi:Protein FMP42, partial [Candida tropicalis]
MRTWWFVLTTLFSIIMMLRINYFVATIGTQYQYIFGSIEISDSLNKFFDIALPLGGIVSVPFIGLFL